MKKSNVLLDNFFGIAKIVSTKGFKGEMKIIFHDKEYVFRKNSFIFITRENLPVPYKVEYYTESTVPLLKLARVDSVEESKKLIGSVILYERTINNNKVTSLLEDFNAYNGLNVYNNDNEVGKIIRIEEFPSQIMATVLIANGQEKYVPLVENWIIGINLETMTLKMKLPDGLV